MLERQGIIRISPATPVQEIKIQVARIFTGGASVVNLLYTELCEDSKLQVALRVKAGI